MPTLDQAVGGDSRRKSIGRWKMMVVMLVCAAPVVASYFTFYVVRPESRRSFGELIDPQRPTPDQPAVALRGESINLRSLKGQWLLVSVAGGACNEACINTLYLQRQLREGLGREKDRMDWVWLVSDDVPVPTALQPGLAAATVLRLPRERIAEWLAPAVGSDLTDHLYVVDPMGHWMLRFAPRLSAIDAPKAKRDLERLLRASVSWDKAGREPAN